MAPFFGDVFSCSSQQVSCLGDWQQSRRVVVQERGTRYSANKRPQTSEHPATHPHHPLATHNYPGPTWPRRQPHASPVPVQTCLWDVVVLAQSLQLLVQLLNTVLMRLCGQFCNPFRTLQVRTSISRQKPPRCPRHSLSASAPLRTVAPRLSFAHQHRPRSLCCCSSRHLRRGRRECSPRPGRVRAAP